MLPEEIIAKRLRRFELLAGMVYPQAPEVFKIWKEKVGDMTEADFIKACVWIEDNAISWHILPTPTDLRQAHENTQKRYRGA